MNVFRKSDRDGEMIIDNREAPNFTVQEAIDGGRSVLIQHNFPKLLKMATYTCYHCDRVVIKNPLRTRNRHWCPQCDHEICDDPCAVALKLTGECRCRPKRVDEHMKKYSQPSLLLTP